VETIEFLSEVRGSVAVIAGARRPELRRGWRHRVIPAGREHRGIARHGTRIAKNFIRPGQHPMSSKSQLKPTGCRFGMGGKTIVVDTKERMLSRKF